MADFNLSPVLNDAQLDNDGLPLTGGKIYWYLAGTTTPATVYRTSVGTPHTNPVILNVRGEPPDLIWLPNGQTYKAILKDGNDVTIRIFDQISGVGDTSVFPSTFTEILIDSTGNAGRIYQSSTGRLTLGCNNTTGTVRTIDLSGDRAAFTAPITVPALRTGDATVPTLPLEVAGSGIVTGDLTVRSSDSGTGPIRRALSANRNYYVRTDGNDANNGQSNTAEGAFATIRYAVNQLLTLDLQQYAVTINIADGTYTDAVELPPLNGNKAVTLLGNESTPANVHLNVAGAAALSCLGAGSWVLSGLKFSCTGGSGLDLSREAVCAANAVEFGACTDYHVLVRRGGAIRLTGTPLRITGNAKAFARVYGGGQLECLAQTVTLIGTPAFSEAFVIATRCGTQDWTGSSFTNTATGTRYDVTLNGVIVSPAGGATDFPGDGAGTAATGGQYA